MAKTEKGKKIVPVKPHVRNTDDGKVRNISPHRVGVPIHVVVWYLTTSNYAGETNLEAGIVFGVQVKGMATF